MHWSRPRRKAGEELRADALPWRRRGKKRADQHGCEAPHRGGEEQDGRMARDGHRIEGAHGDEQRQRKGDATEDTEAAVAHDGEAALGSAPGEAIDRVREPVEMQTARDDLPRRHEENGPEERRDKDKEDAIEGDETAAQRQPHWREPPGGPAEGSGFRCLAAGYGHDGEKSQGEDE